MAAVTNEDVSRVLTKDREACALQIYAFGEGQVVRDGRVPVAEWHGATKKEMFFYILLHGPLTRDEIGVVFWPDSSTERVASSFHTMLRQIRAAVGAAAVVQEGGKYRLGDITYWFDVEEFEALVKQARLLGSQGQQAEHLWGRAVALYRGDFLSQVDRVWCVSKREMLRDMYVEALLEMGKYHTGRREFEQAMGWYRRALEVNELREDVHRGCMRCYFEAGRRSEAVAQYRRCEEILERELGVGPSAETVRLYEQIVGNGPRTDRSRPG
jgi:LuxR family maltose regulon positive regulatory protein